MDDLEGSGTGKHVLFVSYGRADEAVVKPLVDLLRLVATDVFRDRDSIRPGAKWRVVIESAVDRCTDFLLFWCAHAEASREVAAEYGQALGLNKRVVPMLLDETSLTADLAQYQAIDMRTFDPHVRASPAFTQGISMTPHEIEVARESVNFAIRKEAVSYLASQLNRLFYDLRV